MEISFKINGAVYKASSNEIPIDTSLNTYLRSHAHLSGTKFMCLEGGCGACMVTLKRIHPITQKQQIFSVNSCLKSLYACDGLEIITIEGIGNKKDGYHPIQKRLNQMCGSQCGYCSPGMVVSMYSLLESSENRPTMEDIERSLGGNICRCTGYRPILDAFKSLASDADQKLIDACSESNFGVTDIEDLQRSCSMKRKTCVGHCSNHIERSLHFEFEEDRHWYKPIDMKGLLDVISNCDGKAYMVMGGNTAQGIIRLSRDIRIFIDISTIPELHRVELGKEDLSIGGSVSLKEAMDLLRKTAAEPGFEYCLHLAQHIQLIACDSIRNLGTIAGNLCFKNLHNEFPSDLYTILIAANARLTIVEPTNQQTQLPIDDFLSHQMNKKILYKIMLPRKRFPPIFKTYKVMVRAQNAHAYVNAGFSIDVTNNNEVSSARLCYGGINATFVRATKTEQILVGKNLYTNDTLQIALGSLAAELKPDSVLPDASALYRKNLAIALFYKFILSTAPGNKITPMNLSGGSTIERPISSGIQNYVTVSKNWPLTKPVLKYEGLVQCAGEALYINDMPPMQKELWAAFVVATKIHAKIGSIDTSEAMAIPGVRYFFSAKDIPGKNDFTPVAAYTNKVEEIFVGAESEVLYHGQPIGIILADTMNLAVYAATKVKIIYVLSTRQIVPTIKDAIELDAKNRFYEIENRLVASSFGIGRTQTMRGHFQIEGQYHFTMEPQLTLCIPAEDGIDVHSSTQSMDFTQMAVAGCLGMRENQVNMVLRRIGGGFGGKVSRSTLIACACAIACILTNRPVRFVMTIEACMRSLGKRYGLFSDYIVDIDDNGKIQNMFNNYAQDQGCSMNEQVEFFTTQSFANCYVTNTWSTKSEVVLTDSASNTFFRAPGSLEGIAMIENIMEHIAAVTGKDSVDVRLANMAEDHPLRRISMDFLKDIEYRKRLASCVAFNKANRWRKRGIAVVFMNWPTEVYFSYPVYVAIYHRDGTVVLTHGGIECGQGIHTKVAQVAAFALGVPLEFVSVKPTDNVSSANSMLTGGSCTSEMAAFATKKACEILVERMKPVRVAMPANSSWPELTEACYLKGIDLRATYLLKNSDTKPYIINGAACAEMEVDILTGNYQVTRVDIVEDVGESISPHIDVGQVEGAFVMGMGYWLTEKLVYSRENGELLSDRTWNYKPPGANDIPIDFRITFLQNSPNPNAGVLRSKTVGEPATCMSVVVMFALRNAIAASRSDEGVTEWFTLGSASTPEQAFLAAGKSIEHFTL